MIMNKNNFLKATSNIIIGTREKCEDVLWKYHRNPLERRRRR